ncbi:MAG: aldo/keto reductase [Clostridiales Family XIII bacterium]|jgi:predicted aldo/keto reductase-like oxidoreductase|nr:aldo/keto reductase [Clostridiales Family XIII bacterium]
MNYRYFKAGGSEVSLLGFGAMRLPTIGGGHDKIDEAEAVRMIRYAIDHGVNYVDTAYVYHGMQSEAVVGKALADGYRDKTMLATKMPFWIMKGPGDMGKILDEQLEKLATDCIDMYLIHDIHGERWDTVKAWKIWDFLSKAREEGKIRFIGFSFHGESPEEFKTILDEYPWDFCQLQINYMDKDLQAGVAGYEYAVSKGVPVVVMEPLKGGKLSDVMPPSIQAYWDTLESDRSPAEWALRWAANLPGVLTILSGMSAMGQVEENIRVLSDADAGMLTENELEVIDKAAESYRKLIAFPCTACKYCMPCTVSIAIPVVMDFRNSYNLYGKTDKMQSEFNMFVNPKPSDCVACGKCEEECPQHLEIVRAMRETAGFFEA